MAEPIGDPILIAQDISVEYEVRVQRNSAGRLRRLISQVMGQKQTVHAVRGVSFVVHRGETIGLVGANGSGKSSIIRVLAGLQRPSTGAVWARSTPAMLSINGTMMKNLSGARNIRLGLFALGLSPAEVAEHYPRAIELSGLRKSIHHPLETYSSGMRARLKFAVAVAKVPDILLVDEALGTGDARFAGKSQKLLEEIRESAGAVVMVNHSANAIRNACTRVIWLDKGVIRADGPTEEVMALYEASTAKKPKSD